MNPFQEMMNKTGVMVRGLVSQLNEFTPKPTADNPEPKTYHSVDVIVKDHKNAVTVKLPPEYDRAKIVSGELVSLPVLVKIYNGKASFQMV